MTLFKAKSSKKQVVNVLVILALFSQILSPAQVSAVGLAKLAEIGQKLTKPDQAEEVFVRESAEGNMFLPYGTLGRPNKVVKAVITAYTSTPDQTDDSPFISASGKRVYDGMIAANWLPFGTKIKIPALYGDKLFTVDDRMHPRYGYGRMDMWLNTEKTEARQFGVKRVEVEIYYPKKELAVK